MSPTALLLLLLISAAGTAVEAYPLNEELSKTVNEGEAVQSGKLTAGPLEVRNSEKAGGGVDVGRAALERKGSNGASTRSDKENDVDVRCDKEKRINTKTKREAENPTVKSAVDKAPIEEGAVRDRNVNGKDNYNGNVVSKTSPSKDKEGKNAVVNKIGNSEGSKSEVAALSTNGDKNVKANVKDPVAVRDLSGEAAEATQNAAEAEADADAEAEADADAEAETKQSPAEKMEKVEDSSEEAAVATKTTSVAESRSATQMLARQSVPISRVAFESDLESLSPELRALQQAGSFSQRKNMPPVSEVMDDIRKRPMVSRIKYAKETLFPPIGGQSSSTDQLNHDMQLSKVSVNPYKGTWELNSDPLAVKLMKGATPDLEHRIDPSTEEQLQSPAPRGAMNVLKSLMEKLQKLANQFIKAIHFIRNSDMVPNLSDKRNSTEFNVTPEHRKVVPPNSTAVLSRKLKSLSNELALVKNMKKIMDGKVNGAYPLTQKLESLSSELAVDEAIEKSLGNPATNLRSNRNYDEKHSA